MDQRLRSALAGLASDTESGASEILARALGVLHLARDEGKDTLVEAARAVWSAQPSMASLRNAAAAALADLERPGSFDRFSQRARRAPDSLRRVAVEALLEPGRENHLTTCSFSASVLSALLAIGAAAPLTVACAEGRPGLEGRRLAAALAKAGIRVEFYTDAALGQALDHTHGVVLGADAVAPGWFVNKCGTAQLLASASLRGTPAFVLATRDKFLSAAVADRLAIVERAADEVWDAAPPGVHVHNAYFERVPLDLLAAIVTDAGALGVDMVEEACRASEAMLSAEVLVLLP